MKRNQQSPTTWRLTSLLAGSMFLLISTMQWENARSKRQYWEAGFSSGLAALSIAPVFFKRRRWAWEEEERAND